MATSDLDAEQLISRFCGALAPADRDAFRAAAESALGTIVCAGEGVAYRTLREVWRGYFHPPPDLRVAHTGARHYRESKLQALPAVGADDPRTGGRDRHRLRAE
jgi:hypothetical protein